MAASYPSWMTDKNLKPSQRIKSRLRAEAEAKRKSIKRVNTKMWLWGFVVGMVAVLSKAND